MFERFTDDARAVVTRARESARTMRHGHIGTEHLLLALADERAEFTRGVLREHGVAVSDLRARVARSHDSGLDADALALLGIDLDEVRRVTEANFGPGALDADARRQAPSGRLPLTKRAKKVLELSLREALRLDHKHIAAGHILLGLLREGEGLGARVLTDAGVDLTSLRDDVGNRLTTADA